MAAYGINAGDVASAIRRENIDLPAGRVGQPPAVPGQAFDMPDRRAGPALRAGAIRRHHCEGGPGPARSDGCCRGRVARAGPLGIAQSAGSQSSPRQHGNRQLAESAYGAGQPEGQCQHGGRQRNHQRGHGRRPLGRRVDRRRCQYRRRRHDRRRGHGDRRGDHRRRPVRQYGRHGHNPRQRSGRAARPAAPSAAGTTGEITGLSINNQTTAVLSAGGVIPGTTLAGGPPRPSVGIVRLRDVARVEMGAENYRQAVHLRRAPVGRRGRVSTSGNQCLGHRHPRASEDGWN